MDGEKVVKIAAVGVGAYFLYNWLVTNGYIPSLFGASNSFSTPATLLSYCAANPTGTAVYTGTSPSVTEPCSQWNAAATSAPATTTPVNSTPATNTPVNTSPNTTAIPVDPNLVAQLTSLMQAQAGRPNGTTSEWNWIEQNKLNPSAAIVTSPQYGDTQITATQYLQLRQSSGLSGLGFGKQPERWVM